MKALVVYTDGGEAGVDTIRSNKGIGRKKVPITHVVGRAEMDGAAPSTQLDPSRGASLIGHQRILPYQWTCRRALSQT